MALAVLHISHIQFPLYNMIAVTPAHVYASVCRLAFPWRLGVVGESRLALTAHEIVLHVQAGKGSHQQTGSQKPAKLAAETTTGLLAVEGEVPIMMPAKLATNKACMSVFDTTPVALQLLSECMCTCGPICKACLSVQCMLPSACMPGLSM